jgi:hypothetical protein
MDELQARKELLLAQLVTADAPVPLLHPNLTAGRSQRWRRPSRTHTVVLRLVKPCAVS